MWSDLTDLFLPAFWETPAMVGVSGGIGTLPDVPLGVLLYPTTTGGMLSALVFNRVTSPVANVVHSVPFIILLVAVIPFTRLLAGSSIGTAVAIVSLTVAAIPFVAHLIETALREVDRGLIEAAQSTGATTGQLVYKVLLPKAMPGIPAGLTITFVDLVGYSAIANTIGGDGLGDLGTRYDYQRCESDIMLTVIIILIVFMQAVQSTGNQLVRHLNRR